MPRTIELSVSADKVDAVLDRLGAIDGVVGLVRHPGASLQPPGDVLAIQTTNDATRAVMAVLGELQVLDAGSISTHEPRSVIAPAYQAQLDRESNETIWDEMVFLLRADTNLAPNFILLMALAGAIAGVGLWTDTLHTVIGAMVIAPAFEPLVQIPLGLLTRRRQTVSSGIRSSAAGYLALAGGATATVLLLQLADPGRSADLHTRAWVQFWTSVTPTAVVSSLLAAIAGAIVISGQRSVLTTGVMIALALIPSMAIVGMGLGVGDLALAGRGAIRWAVDATLVMVLAAVVLRVKRAYLRPHPALS